MGTHLIHENYNIDLKPLPTRFCWTKMGDEAGQGLNGIIARKDTERVLGNGVFFWGIGTALGQRIWKFIKSIDDPLVLFSPMKTRAKMIDAKPDKIFAWTAYVDCQGTKHSMPDHALVTSRGTVGEKIKSSHYALVCKKNTSLSNESWPLLNSANLRNYDTGSMIGFSQVTSVVESRKTVEHKMSPYQILFAADMVDPFYVTLVDPVEIPNHSWEEVNQNWLSKGYSIKGWDLWLKTQKPGFRKIFPGNGQLKLMKRHRAIC